MIATANVIPMIAPRGNLRELEDSEEDDGRDDALSDVDDESESLSGDCGTTEGTVTVMVLTCEAPAPGPPSSAREDMGVAI